MSAVEGGYATLRRDVGAVWLARDVVMVQGPDAAAFLQGQLSQDVLGLDVGASGWSFVLQPQGKVDAFVRVLRSGDHAYVLDIDGGWGEALLARLRRFLLRVQVELAPIEWRCLAIRGPRAHAVARPAEGRVVVPADWPGLPGVDLLGPSPAVPDGVAVCPLGAYEVVRVEAGVPTMGAELTEATIPAETGLIDRAVSFTKGCFTGQELVARIDSRGGNVPRHLRGVVIGAGGVPPVGAAVVVGGAEVGRLTSVATSPERQAPVALAYVARAVVPPAEGEVVWGGGAAPASVEELPLAGRG
ncbi:MAG: hypothetical protein IPM45_17270 [Acidimicrobiales bacterium]|nr:hypothetical protein [Acidimicrobiales bacterium]